MRSQNCKSTFRKALKLFTLLFITTIHLSFAQDIELGESLFSSNCASCHYLGPESKKLIGPGLNDYILEKHKNGGLKPSVDSEHSAKYLQWFHYCEGMVMPPMNTIVVHTVILPPERRDETVLGQAQRLLSNALKPVNENLEGKDYLIGDFSGADIMLGHSCFMSNRLGCVSDEMSYIIAYVEKLESRPAFKKAIETQ